MTLRPTFAAMHQIETASGLRIDQLIAKLEQPSFPADLIRLILQEGLLARYGTQQLVPTLRRRSCLRLRESAIEFLLCGLGYQPETDNAVPTSEGSGPSDATPPETPAASVAAPCHATSNPDRATRDITTPEPLPWPCLYQTATGVLRRSEAEFWSMTMHGLMLQCEAFAAAEGLDIPAIGTPATQEELAILMARFPDEKKQCHNPHVSGRKPALSHPDG